MKEAVATSLWRKLFSRGESLSKFLPYEAYDEETGMFLLSDGGDGFSIAAFIEIDPLPAGSVDDKIAEDISRMIEIIYTSPSIQEGTALQFILYSSPFYEDVLEKWYERRKDAPDILREFAKRRTEFYKKHSRGFFKDTLFVPRTFRAFITYRAFVKVEEEGFFKRLFKSEKKLYEPKADLEEHRKRVEGLLSNLRTIQVGQSSLNPRLLNAQQFIELLVELLNMERIPVVYNPDFPIREQILYKAVEVKPDGRWVIGRNGEDETHLVVLGSKTPPPEPDIRKTSTLLGDLFQNQRQIPFPFFITLNTERMDQFKIKGAIQRRHTIGTLQANSPLALFNPNKVKEVSDLDYALKMHSDGHEFVRAYLTFVAYTKSDREARDASSHIQGILRYVGFNPYEETSIAGTAFLKALPGGYEPKAERFLRRGKTILTNNLAHITPILGDWKGTKTPTLLFLSRRGDFITIDLFDSPGNYNAVIAAASGSGKSFFANDIIMQYLSIGARVFVIDIGYSYQKLCEVMDGEFIEFEEGGGISLNPFTNARTIAENPEVDPSKIEDPEMIDSEDLSLIVPLLSKMAAGTEKLTRSQEGVLEQAIVEAFKEKKRETTITDVWERLRKHGTKDGEDLANMLYPYTKNGRFGKYFEPPCNIEFTKPFVVLEFQGLRSHKDLQAVVLMAAISQIQKAIQKGDRKQRKLLIVDEAWDLLSDVHAAKFIEAGYRIFRKYNASAISITQSINDLYQNEAGRAAAENADFFFLLRQKAESIEYIKKSGRLLLNKTEFNLVKSVATYPGKFSEIFFYTPLGKDVGRLVIDPFSYWLYTTKGDEVAEIKRRQQTGKKIHEVIAELAEEYPRGK